MLRVQKEIKVQPFCLLFIVVLTTVSRVNSLVVLKPEICMKDVFDFSDTPEYQGGYQVYPLDPSTPYDGSVYQLPDNSQSSRQSSPQSKTAEDHEFDLLMINHDYLIAKARRVIAQSNLLDLEENHQKLYGRPQSNLIPNLPYQTIEDVLHLALLFLAGVFVVGSAMMIWFVLSSPK
jgi:hypothetical protein